MEALRSRLVTPQTASTQPMAGSRSTAFLEAGGKRRSSTEAQTSGHKKLRCGINSTDEERESSDISSNACARNSSGTLTCFTGAHGLELNEEEPMEGGALCSRHGHNDGEDNGQSEMSSGKESDQQEGGVESDSDGNAVWLIHLLIEVTGHPDIALLSLAFACSVGGVDYEIPTAIRVRVGP
jgi:hypothetical protein